MNSPRPARTIRTALAATALAATLLAGILLAGTMSAGPATAGTRHASSATSAPATRPAAHGTRSGADGVIRPPCAAPVPGHAQCFLAYRPQPAAAAAAGTAARPAGLTARAIRAAFKLPSKRTSHQTVAVSIAFDTPKLAAFLATYRRHYGLPPCTTASRCLRIVNQQGKTAPPPPSGKFTGWDLEASLDVSMISVACPHCRILVVEANNNSTANLAATERTAARLGAQVISNSYGGPEDGLALSFRQAYRQPGHTIVASSGDIGFTDASFPADLPNVTAVGGTTLTRAANKRGWRETVWNNSFGAGGSGCSAWVSKPAWQHDTHCPMRTIADISAVASNVPVFNSTYGGWVTVFGTSIAAPLVAGIYGLVGNGTTVSTARLYRHPGAFFDITAGHNSFVFGFPPAQACGNDYLCVAKKNYDAPTGLGTPNGIGAF